MTEKIELPPRMLELYRLLRTDRDTPIAALHEKFIGRRAPTKTRDAQLRITPYIHRLNEHIRPHGLLVRPGEKRRTYRLYSI